MTTPGIGRRAGPARVTDRHRSGLTTAARVRDVDREVRLAQVAPLLRNPPRRGRADLARSHAAHGCMLGGYANL